MTIKELPISKIKIYQNIRSILKDVSGLMKSIASNGLQHPIGVYETKNKGYILAYGARRLEAVRKLGWKTIPCIIIPEEFSEENFLTQNTIENIHRQEIAPMELGKVCRMLTDKGYSFSEIAAKFSIPTTRVRDVWEVYKKVPRRYRELIGFVGRGESNKGKIPLNVALTILKSRIPSAQKEELFKYAKQKEFSTRHIHALVKMIRGGVSVQDAVKNLDKYAVKNIFLTVDIERLAEIEEQKITLTDYVKDIIRGNKPADSKLLVD